MNVKPITGNANLATLKTITDNIGGLTTEDLERECAYLKAGIKAARGKIARAVDRQRGAKWILKHRSTLPESVVNLAIAAKPQEREKELIAGGERDAFLQQYRNFRQFLYIQKSVELIASNQE